MKLLVTSIIVIAISEVCYGKVEIRKCCGLNEYVVGRKDCKVNETENLELGQVKVYTKDLKETGTLDGLFSLRPNFLLEGKNNIQSFVYNFGRLFSDFHLMQDGTVFLSKNGTNRTKIRNPDSYCIDYKEDIKLGKIIVVFIKNNNSEELPETPTFMKYGFLISSIFLLLLLVVYSILPELRSLGGMILMAYAGSLMMAYLSFFSLKIRDDNPPLTFCLSATFLIYFFLLASFCWMNVMSYDIWWTFRGYAKARSVHRRGVNFKFAMYCLYAWGIPLAMTIALAILNETEQEKLPGIIKPEIPGKGCFLMGTALRAYLHGPMFIMIVLNWLLFGMTVFNIWRLSRGTQILSCGNPTAAGTPSAHRTQKHRFLVYLKLSVVMGLSWILEVVSSFYPKLQQGWNVSDTYNIFIGFLIFVIFVCKKKILRSLKKRFANDKVFHSTSSASTKSRTRSTLDSSSNSQSVPLKPMPNTTDPAKTDFR